MKSKKEKPKREFDVCAVSLRLAVYYVDKVTYPDRKKKEFDFKLPNIPATSKEFQMYDSAIQIHVLPL